MDFNIFPLVMIAVCVLMMVLMMRGMQGGHRGALSIGKFGCCGFGFGLSDERSDRLPTQSSWRQQPTSGNRSFDDYRQDTLHRLEEEQRHFQDFLARLRMAKDQAEFDQFMTERRTGR
jgi:Protein of unknown function (DUF2852)